jgi:prepilin-type N-terminal cleavage/methylation domain-containing protein
MQARRRPAGPRAAGAGPADAGFTLIETLVSMTLITIVLAALTGLLVTTISVSNRQVGRQVAIQLADDGTERVHALKGSALADGRDQSSVDTQWAGPVTAVGGYLADMQEVWDTDAGYPSGATAALPTTAVTATVNGLDYQQNWYVGRCWQPSTGGDCTAAAAAGTVAFFRVVVAVTWTERACPATGCSYVVAVLVSDSFGDPTFNSNQTAQPPAVDNPGSSTAEVSVPASLQLTSTGGAPPITWSASGLPAGLSVSSAGLVSGTPTTAGTYSVIASATDGFGLIGTAAFSWTVSPVLALTSPGSRTTGIGTTVSVSVPQTGGAAPLAWSVTAPAGWGSTGLPPGLTIDDTTGVISGVPTTSGSNTVTVTAVDALGKTASVSFLWTVPTLQVTSPGAQTVAVGTATTLQLASTGGTTPYTWSATGLPAGLTISSTGKITGTPTAGSRYLVTAQVKDATGAIAAAVFSWTVSTSGLKVTSPTGDRTGDTAGQTVSLTATASGGTGFGRTWTATGLPSGLTASGATISGTLTQSGSYLVTLKVTDSGGNTATFMFTWTVS